MITTIKLESDTRDRLVLYGKKAETYDILINRILDELDAYRAAAKA